VHTVCFSGEVAFPKNAMTTIKHNIYGKKIPQPMISIHNYITETPVKSFGYEK